MRPQLLKYILFKEEIRSLKLIYANVHLEKSASLHKITRHNFRVVLPFSSEFAMQFISITS